MTTQPIEPSDKTTVEPEFPPVQCRVTKWFGTTRVDHCVGENPNAWNSGAWRHWLEIPLGDKVIRQSTHGYSFPAYLKHEGKTYVAFTAYWDGEMPIEQPLQLIVGQDQ